MAEKRNPDGFLVIGGAALAAVIAAILAARPVKAAPPDEKLDYLIELQATTVQLLGQMVILLQQLVAAAGIPPGVEVTLLTPWIAKDTQEIFNRAVRETLVTLDSDRMVNYAQGKRVLFKIESSLDQAVNIQIVGNIEDSMSLATNIGTPLPCAANGNISVGLAWDDWHPYVSARIIVGVAPTTGILTIRAVIQE